MGCFISLSIYVDAISKDFKAILSEMNNEMIMRIGNRKSAKSQANKDDLSPKLTEAILLHYKMNEYSFTLFISLKFEIGNDFY